VLCRLDQSVKHRVRINLKHAGHGADAEPFGERTDGLYQLLGRYLLAMKQRAVRFLEIAMTTETLELAAASPTGMTVGAEIAKTDPALIRTVGVGAEVA
jgi:hypothetical protein